MPAPLACSSSPSRSADFTQRETWGRTALFCTLYLAAMNLAMEQTDIPMRRFRSKKASKISQDNADLFLRGKFSMLGFISAGGMTFDVRLDPGDRPSGGIFDTREELIEDSLNPSVTENPFLYGVVRY